MTNTQKEIIDNFESYCNIADYREINIFEVTDHKYFISLYVKTSVKNKTGLQFLCDSHYSITIGKRGKIKIKVMESNKVFNTLAIIN